MRVEPRRFVLGSLIAVIALALHSLVDYGLHKPANAFLFALIGG